jgi:hypothetical protein
MMMKLSRCVANLGVGLVSLLDEPEPPAAAGAHGQAAKPQRTAKVARRVGHLTMTTWGDTAAAGRSIGAAAAAAAA